MLCSQAARAPRGLRLHQGRQLAVDLREGRGQRGGQGVEAQVQVGTVVAAPLLLGRAVRDQLAPAAAEELEVLDGGAGLGPQRGPHRGREPRQHARVQPVGLGQDAVGAGEVASLARIDDDDWQASGAQGGDHGPLVATAGFQHDAGRPQRLELPRQPPQAAACARDRPGRPRGLHGHVQLGLRHIDPHRHVRWCRHWVPSGNAGHAPCLADAGSCSRPRQLFGLWASVRAGTTLLCSGLRRPRCDRSVPARSL